ncbi:ABC-three component system middle component 2 [Bisbaumannia pacifica]|uniref:Antitoxin SocA-like Panacea domain-containing protein n=1 Tax=Bisbaumannia pacifica TaxID=77098 RepID=A0ABD4L1L9_9GAMM|nr:ABC-three component system middle component 2 [Halomonas pacifica]MBH8579517.1 hypothetical protein [Halomonas pacifica]
MGEVNSNSSMAFNSPYELGVRMVYLLNSMFPHAASLQKLLLLDYAVIYSKDFGGPESLHTPVPYRNSELYVRYDSVKTGIYLMSTKKLIDINLGEQGVTYFAGENARVLIDSIDSDYLNSLSERCDWVTRKFGKFDTVELAEKFNDLGHRWSAEIDVNGLVGEG